MGTGKTLALSPITLAILFAEKGTTGEIRVHLSKKWIERDPFRRAAMIFDQFRMKQTTDRNAALLYLNTRRRKFAIVVDDGLQKKVGQRYWEELSKYLREDLQSTHMENAIGLTIRTLGVTLKKHFPKEEISPDSQQPY